jgi:hypothetical protein
MLCIIAGTILTLMTHDYGYFSAEMDGNQIDFVGNQQ